MPQLLQQRCLNHFQREAVARCTGCGQYFCRECITEHDARVLCAACLRNTADVRPVGKRRWAGLVRLMQWVAGVALAWLFFYVAGECLLSLPSSFHEGTIWHSNESDAK